MPRGKPSKLLRKRKIRKQNIEEGGGKLRRTDPNGNRLVQELEPYKPKPKYLDLGMHR